jgi:hypothetical protein
LSFFKLMRIYRSRLPPPLANRFIGEHDATAGMPFFDLSEPEAEPLVQPDGMTDTFRWNTKNRSTRALCNQDTSKSNPGQLDNTMRGGKID